MKYKYWRYCLFILLLYICGRSMICVCSKYLDSTFVVMMNQCYGVEICEDVSAPDAVITFLPSQCQWGKDIYGSADSLVFEVFVSEQEKAGCSGIQRIECWMIDLDTGYMEVVKTNSFRKEERMEAWSGQFDINKAVFTSNRVKVFVKVSDWAGNAATVSSEEIKVDNFKPIVKMYMDMTDVVSGKYFHSKKVLTIQVFEKNFDSAYLPKIYSDSDNGYEFSGWEVTEAGATGQVLFRDDGKYRVTYQCYDLAGNKSEKVFMEEIIIDQTPPILTIVYNQDRANNELYYSKKREATILIEEHNFNYNNVSIERRKDGKAMADETVTWHTEGDCHSAKFVFEEDGEYEFYVDYIDLAGNRVGVHKVERFIIDKTSPQICIENLVNNRSYNDVVSPIISVTDKNFSMDNMNVALIGKKRGHVDIESIRSVEELKDGIKIIFKNFPEMMDDIYVLNISANDKAGNKVEEKYSFIVNREGAAYSLDDATVKLIENYYISTIEDILLKVEDLDVLKSYFLTYSKDDDIIKLKENVDYDVFFEQTKEGKKKYTFKIKSSSFDKDGVYVITLHTIDAANNESTNTIKGVNLQFALDSTKPVMHLVNIEDGGRYLSNSYEFTANIKDNVKLFFVDLYIDDQCVKRYLPNEIYGKDGLLYITAEGCNRYQNIRMVAVDCAGNMTETETYKVLITDNKWIQLLTDHIFWMVSIGIFISTVLIIISDVR